MDETTTEKIDTLNRQVVGIGGKGIVVLCPLPSMTKSEALSHAAWLVVLAEEEDGEFQKVLDAIRNT